MKRILTILVLFIFGIILTVGCTQENLISTPHQNFHHNNNLNIYNWSSYIDPEIIREFEQQFKVKVNYDIFESNDELYNTLKLHNSDYDLIFPSDYMVSILIKEGFLEKLNLDKIPNYKHINSKFLDTYFDPSNHYSLPYQWGTMGIGYNIKKTGEIKSWKQIFEFNKNHKIALINESRSMLGAILIYLGYDINTQNAAQIAQARDFLIQHKALIESFSEKSEILLKQGIVDIGIVWNGDILKYQTQNSNLSYVIPEEGSLIWLDNITILKTAPHKALAEKFINFVFDPKISAKISNRTKYGSPNQTSVKQKLINSKDLNNPAIYPPSRVFNRLTYLKDVGEARKLYDQAWREVQIKVDKL